MTGLAIFFLFILLMQVGSLQVKHLKQKKSQLLLRRHVDFLFRNYRLVLLLFIAITLVFGFFAVKLEQQTSVRDLLPAHNKIVQQFEETVTNFDLVDRVVVVLKFDPRHLEQAQTFAEILVDQIQNEPSTPEYLYWLIGNLYAETQAANWYGYLRYLTRLLPPSQLDEMIEKLSTEGIHHRVGENRRELESGLTSKYLIENDPLNLLDFAGSYRREVMGNYQISFTDGFLVSHDRTMLLILGKPKKSPEDVDFSVGLEDFLNSQVEAAKTMFRDEEDIEPDSLFEIGLTGPHPITAREKAIISADVKNMFVSSFAMVLLLFVLAYRRPLAIFYVGLPLLLAEVWTLGMGYLMFGHLNLLTAAFSAVIVGLGIDYAIHLFSRYLDERILGHDCLEAMRVALCETGMGTLIGGLTTALAFLSMAFANFSGLREFGIIASLGIILCLLQMFVLLPCMLFWRESWRKKKNPYKKAQWDFHVEALIRWCLNHKKIAAGSMLAITLFLGWQALQLRFTTDIRSIRARSNPSIMLQNEVTAKVGGSLRGLSFVLEAETEEQLYRLHDQLLPTLTRLKQEGGLARFDSLLAFLHGPQQQQANIDTIEEAGLSGSDVAATFLAEMEAAHFRVTENSRQYIENLTFGLDVREPVTLQQILSTDARFVRAFLNFSDGRFKTLIHVYPSKGLWEKESILKLTQTITDSVTLDRQSDLFLTGIQTISDELKRLVRQSFQYSTLIAIFLVVSVLFLHFRHLALVLLTLLPLMCSIIWMLGTMKLLQIDITILNFVATPLIIGIGIDDGVHIVEKYLHRSDAALDKLIASCGKAVTLTSLTTIMGFSSLFLANYSGFRSLGLCAILGVAFSWLAAVVLLPLLMDLFAIKFIRTQVSTMPTANSGGSEP